MKTKEEVVETLETLSADVADGGYGGELWAVGAESEEGIHISIHGGENCGTFGVVQSPSLRISSVDEYDRACSQAERYENITVSVVDEDFTLAANSSDFEGFSNREIVERVLDKKDEVSVRYDWSGEMDTKSIDSTVEQVRSLYAQF